MSENYELNDQGPRAMSSPSTKESDQKWFRRWFCRHLETAEKRFAFAVSVAAFAFAVSGVLAAWEAVRIAKDTKTLDRIADNIYLISERLWLVYEALLWATRLLLRIYCNEPKVRTLLDDKPPSDADKFSTPGRTRTQRLASRLRTGP